MAVPVVADGGTGVVGDAICYAEDGLYCASDWTCQRLVAVGGACTDVGSCVSGAYCSTAGMCEALKAAGAACTQYYECLGSCDTATGTCVGDTGDLEVTAEVCAGNFGGSSDDSASAPPVSRPAPDAGDAG
jgi:hypothetical protein